MEKIMSEYMNENAKRICNDNIDNFCRVSCPLTEECKQRYPNGKAETSEEFSIRMNTKADELALKYGW